MLPTDTIERPVVTHTIRRALITSSSVSVPVPPPGKPAGTPKFRISGNVALTAMTDTPFDIAIGKAFDDCQRAHEGTGLKPILAYFFSKKECSLKFNASSFEMPRVFTRSRKDMCPTLFDLRMSETGMMLAHVLVEIRTTGPQNGRPGGLFLELRGLMLSH